MSPAILQPLREALTLAFWYRQDLRRHLNSCLPDHRALVAQLDWTEHKRNTVGQLIDTLYANQHKFFDALLTLILGTAEITDPAHLKRLDDGERKYEEATTALDSLRAQVLPYRRMRSEAQAAELRRRARPRNEQGTAGSRAKTKRVTRAIHDAASARALRARLFARDVLNKLFSLYDIDAKGPFRIVGKQIDGAFTLEGTEFLLEAKWRADKAAATDLDTFAAKIGRKLGNTMAYFCR